MSFRDFMVVDLSDVSNWAAVVVALALFFFAFWLVFM